MGISTSVFNACKKALKSSVSRTKISPDMRGKVITIYGNNNLGKTTQATKFPNAIVMPCERGLNAIGDAMVLKTNSWEDILNHTETLTTNKALLKELKNEPITIIIDGLENAGMFCQNYVASKYNVYDVADAKGGYGAWKQYEKEMSMWVNSLTGQGYTIIFLGHQQENKEGQYNIKGDTRTIAPIQNCSDFVVYLTSNGKDMNGKVVPSSAHLAETPEYFARCRFPYVKNEIEEFTAENLQKAIVEGIKKQIEVEGLEEADYESQSDVFESEETSFEEVKKQLQELYYQIVANDTDENEEGQEQWDLIVTKHLGEDTKVSEATKKQVESLRCIRNDVQRYLENLQERDSEE